MFSDFVKALPEALVYAAIYRKGAKMPSGKLAGGKNPTQESFDFKLGPADVALAAQRKTLTSKPLESSPASVAMASSSLTLIATSTKSSLAGVTPFKALQRSRQPRRTPPSTSSAFQKASGMKSKVVASVMTLITKSSGTASVRASSMALTPAAKFPYQGNTI